MTAQSITAGARHASGPETTAMYRDAKFWDKIAARYARRPVPDEAVYQRKLALTREYLRPGAHLLEFGCGTGSTAIAHAPHLADILATDISAEMLAWSTTRLSLKK